MKKQLIINCVIGGMLLVFTSILTSCVQRTLEQLDPASPVNISFNWTGVDKKPSGIKLYFYNSDGTLFSDQTCSADGFKGTLPEGLYKVLAYNVDAQGVAGRYMETYDKAQIVADSVPKSLKSRATETVSISQSSNIYGIVLSELLVSNLTTTNNEQNLVPVSLAKMVTLNIGASNSSAIKNINSTLSGISRAINVSTRELILEEGVLSFVPVSSVSGFQSTVSFFGVIPTDTNLLSITVDFVSGGHQTLEPVDITDKLRKALDGTGQMVPDIKVDIKVDGTINTGFTATLTGWTVVKKDYIFN